MDTGEQYALDSWLEWKARCAIDLCGEPARAYLQSFALARFRHYVARCAPALGLSGGLHGDMGGRDAWHLLETRLTADEGRRGKRSKDWLFRRAELSTDSPQDVIQGGASLIMREAARDVLRLEASPVGMISLHEPLVGGNGDWTLEDLLPGRLDPVDQVAIREYERLAVEHAGSVFEGMSRRERIAALTRRLGLSLAHEAAEQVAGCGKSALFEAYRAMAGRVAAMVRVRYAGESTESQVALSLLVVDKVADGAVLWGRAERGCSPLFAAAGLSGADLPEARARIVAEA